VLRDPEHLFKIHLLAPNFPPNSYRFDMKVPSTFVCNFILSLQMARIM